MSKNIVDIKQLVYKSLRSKALGRALAQLLVVGNAHTDKIQNLQSTYRTLLQYYFDGTDDPERTEVINYLIRETYELTDEICAGYIPVSYCESPIFQRLYAPVIYNEETMAYARQLNSEGSETDSSLATAAIMLSSLKAFSEEKFSLLMEFCKSGHRGTKSRAITALIVCLIYNNERLEYYPQVNNSLNLLFDDEANVSLAQEVIYCIIRATESERISKEVNEEIIPSISKLTPELDKKDDEGKPLPPDEQIYSLQDKLDDMGISDKMHTYAQLQQEGADINFCTFRQLKNFSFFTPIENWLMPFTTDNKDVAELFSDGEEGKFNILETLLKSTTMCDSDKYSLCLNIKSVTSPLKKSLLHNLDAENEAIKETLNELADKSDSTYINHYVQDIYRLVKLHRDSKYYKDIFSGKMNIHNMSFFRFINPNNDFLPKLAAFYSNKKLTDDALEAYLKLLATDTANIQYYKAIGTCYMKLCEYGKAIEYWEKADIIESDNEQTIKKLAHCNKKLGNFEAAEKLFTSLLGFKEDDINYLYNLALCHIARGKFKQALNLLYKMRFIQDDVKDSPEYNLNLGICLWSEGKKREAADALRHYSPLHELERALKESSFNFSTDAINFIIDYLRLS